MAPYQMKATSKPNFQPLAGKKVLAGRIEKQEKKRSQQIKKTTYALHSVLTYRPKKDAFNTALADQVKQESLATNPSSETQATVCPPEEEDDLFNLQDAIPKVGLRFPGEKKGKRPILGGWGAENRVVEALHADMKVIHKRHAQGVISPIFHQAAEMLDEGYIWGLARREDITAEEGSDIWKRFLGKLWVDSNKKWARKLSQHQFTKFFSALAEARWAEIHQPKNDGEEHGLLVRHISMFLDAAERAGFPWANGGDVFSDGDDDDDE